MSKIALCLIVKGTNDEAKRLDKCLSTLADHVDGIFITSTYNKAPNAKVKEVVEKYKANYSEFKWVSDFSIARNFNFSQVTEDFDYIMWSDADDLWRGADKLHEMIDKNPADAYSVYYSYGFDEYDQPSVAHVKTMLVKNDGTFEWKGSIHEDLMTERQISIKLLKGVDRLHITTDDRVNEAKVRNLQIAMKERGEKEDDPRTLWNLGNSQKAAGQTVESIETFKQFIEESGSEEEIYIAHLRIASSYDSLNMFDEAKVRYQTAIGFKYDYPDAYLQLGYFLFNHGDMEGSERALLNGLALEPQTDRMIVFNPRDYDLNPLRVLGKIYINQNKFEKALTCLESCLKIVPKAKDIKQMRDIIKKQLDKFAVVDEYALSYLEAKTKKAKKEIFASIPKKFADHPKVCTMRNELFVKKTSSGKDMAIYCNYTAKTWSSKTFEKEGMGGSEESVVHLSKQFAEAGWNVTVYNNCGPDEFVHNGVTWAPYWKFNMRDKQDVLIAWRSPMIADYKPNCDKLIIDLHDVISPQEFTEARLKLIDKIYVKTEFHKSLFPKLDQKKVVVIPNGQAFNRVDVEKDPNLIINTSSPDRSMSIVPEIFKGIKARHPEAKMKWAYGFDIFDVMYRDDKAKMAWKDGILKGCEEAGIEVLGRITQDEVGVLYEQANVMLYPTEFAEIDCISVKKAQASGCIPVTTDFGALDESVQHGVKIHSEITKDNWCDDGKFDFGVTDEKMKQEFIDKTVEILSQEIGDRTEMREWTGKFDWKLIADKYLKNL